MEKHTIKNHVQWAEYIKRKELKPFQGDLKKQNNEAEIKDLCTRIKKGRKMPICIRKDHDNFILDGHQRLKALNKLAREWRTLEDDNVPVIYITADDEKTARETVLEMNSKYSEFDREELILFSENLDLEWMRLWIDLELGDEPNINKEKEDIIPRWEATKTIKKGDIIKLGEHTLMCGSALDPDDMKNLMKEDKADMVFTDPPYNMNFEWAINTTWGKSKGANKVKIKNDHMSKEDFDTFLDWFIQQMLKYLNGSYYITFYRLGIDVILNAITRNKAERRSLIARYKPNYNLSNSDYLNIYEPIVYWRNGDHNFYGYTCEQDVRQFRKGWVKPISLLSQKGVLFKMGWSYFEIKKVKKKQWEIYDLEQDGNLFVSLEWDTDVREIEKTRLNDLHPTMKPVALVERALRNSTQQWNIVLDVFGGSWTTLIACEKHRRECRMMEYDETHCETIIRRYYQYTNGRKPIQVLNREVDLSLITQNPNG